MNSDIIGNTPLIKISNKIYGKLETYSPTGSVKDRMISYVVQKAVSAKLINKDTVICEATSGNTGISLSAMAAKMGLKCYIFMPSNMSEERKAMMKIFGSVIIDAPENDFVEAIAMRDRFLEDNPSAWSPKQFSNLDNIECHRLITAPEIKKQVKDLGKKWSAFIHGSGTGGTIEGVRKYVRRNCSDTKVAMVIPEESPHGIQGIGDGKDFLATPEKMDDIIKIKTAEAISRAKKFSCETGILVGISSGANILASEKWLAKNPDCETIVTMLCDRGERYMSVYGKI